jgi:uncharacterized repeat protein (TIGR03803 family)
MDNPRRVHLRILLATAIVSLVASAATAQVTETILHRFANGTDGAQPWAALIQATDGNFYGTTGGGPGGATNGDGTVFKMTPDGTVTVLHAFVGGTDGAYPEAPLIQAADGNFYGTTSQGGGVTNCEGGVQRIDCGTVFQMTPDGTVTVLHAFAGGTEGHWPYAAVIQATDGNFYGMAQGGAGCDCGTAGTVFQMMPDGTVTLVYAFAGQPDGAFPYLQAIIQATDGNFYGTTVGGGYGAGVVFELTLGMAPTTTTVASSSSPSTVGVLRSRRR